MLKRLFDFLMSVAGLIALSPIILIICVLIKIFMPGPPFFIQSRVGRGGREFRLIKFRTMSVRQGADEGSFDAGDRSRITRLGKFLRRTKLDELPELINVLRGEMSLVGPRPEVKKWTEVYREKWTIVHTVKPGITDYASIKFRNEEEILASSSDPVTTYRDKILPQKLDMYIDYVNNHTFWGDIKIILHTIKAVILK